MQLNYFALILKYLVYSWYYFRFLATRNSFRSLGFSYRLGFSTVREIVIEVCDAIWKRLGPITMPPPTEETRKNVAAKYKQMWHFPNCIEASTASILISSALLMQDLLITTIKEAILLYY